VNARFKRCLGRVYQLYRRAEGARYWSLLSPSEWAGAPRHAFLGSYRLESDQSFSWLHGEPESGGLAPIARRLSHRDLP